MKPLHRLFVSALIFSLTTSAGLAQHDDKEVPVQQEQKPVAQDEWRFLFTPYFWLPSVNTDILVPEFNIGNRTIGGQISVDQPWWDTLGNLGNDFYVLGIMGRFEAWKGRWGGFLDGYWIFAKSTVSGGNSKLIIRDRVDITSTSSVTSRFDAGQFNFGPQFVLGTAPLSSTSNVSFILYGGGRVNWIGNDLDGTLKIRASANIGEIGQTFSFSSDKSRAFIEPMIGLKTNWSLGEKMNLVVRGDVGGFGVVDGDNWDCDLEAALAWEFHHNTYLDFGYRARGQWQDFGSSNDVAFRGWYYGPELGITFKF